MGERIKELRQALGLSQSAFAEHLGVTRGVITNIEFDKTIPKDQFIMLICREFGVAEAWLRFGEGEMFIQRSRNEEIAMFLNDIMSDADASFRKRFIAAVADLGPDEWRAIEAFARRLVESDGRPE